MNEIELRKTAITRYLSGEKPEQIISDLKRSKTWFYKWLKRYRSEKEQWFLSESKAPKTKNNKVSNVTEQHILSIRKKFTNTKYSQIGALSIQYEFNRLGLKPPPIWTINRVLKRHGLTQKSRKRKSKNIFYPTLYLNTHQMDLVGPRYLKGKSRLYAFNIIDIESHYAYTEIIADKSAKSIIKGLIHFWQTYGIPDSLQMDNELSFRGSNRHPRSLGLILRFVLSQGVVPVFIPVREPWRNGIIEKFNDKFDKKFYRVQKFKDFEHVKQESLNFINFHNQNHRYSAHSGKTPNEMQKELLSPIKLSKDYVIPKQIPLESGTIIFVRFVRSDLKIKVFNTEFVLKKNLIYSYVIAEIIIEQHCLLIKQDNKIHHIFDFLMPVDW